MPGAAVSGICRWDLEAVYTVVDALDFEIGKSISLPMHTQC